MTAACLSAPPRALAHAIEHHMAGRFDDATACYRRLHAEHPADAEILFLMGVLCCDLQAFEPAVQFFDQALAAAPVFPEARAQLGTALNALAEAAIDAGDFALADARLRRAGEMAPEDPGVMRNLARLALHQGSPDRAAALLRASLARRDGDADAWNWLGLACLQLQDPAAAETALRAALRLRPGHNQARNNLGLAVCRQGRAGEAWGHFAEALALDPAYHKARINMAMALRLLGLQAPARAELERVLAGRPEEVDALNNLGVLCQDAGQPEAAIAYLRRALAVQPDCAHTRWNLSLSQLLVGDHRAGWANYESRWEGCEHFRGTYRFPDETLWRGEDLHGKRLLLWAEQGLGDTLQFIRFARDLADRGALVGVIAPSQVAALVRSVEGVARSQAYGEPPMEYDFHCPLLSLPSRLEMPFEASRLRSHAAYLAPSPEAAARWRRRLSGVGGLKVGLVWAGNPRTQSPELHAIDQRRSVPLALFAPLLALPGCTFFSLQQGAAAAQLRQGPQAAARIVDHSEEWRDLADTAALIVNLDLVVSVDTAVAHLAAGLGKPVFLLNRYDTCWRWGLGRQDSVWYDSLRQFRQPQPGDWATPLAAVAALLAGLAGSTVLG